MYHFRCPLSGLSGTALALQLGSLRHGPLWTELVRPGEPFPR